MLYRIITENKVNAKEVIAHAMAANGFYGYTLIRARGYYQGVAEKSIMVEVSAPDRDISDMALRVVAAAKAIRTGLQQEEVIIQEIPCSMEIVR